MAERNEKMRALVAELEQKRAAAREMGGTQRVARQHERGKLDARQRVALRVAVHPAAILTFRFTIGIAYTWYVRCRIHASRPRTLYRPSICATPLCMPSEATAPTFACL